jgi:hypothetical protein
VIRAITKEEIETHNLRSTSPGNPYGFWVRVSPKRAASVDWLKFLTPS